MEDKPKFQAHLQRGGTTLNEMRRLLEAFAEHHDYKLLRKQALEENLLGKSSEHFIKDLLSVFRRVFLKDLGLPPVGSVALAMRSNISDAAKVQILFPYFVRSDPLVERCYRDLVIKRLNEREPSLTSGEVAAHLLELSTRHPELGRWSDYLRLRWSRGFIALLRHFGLMERHPRNEIRRLWLLPEPFAFFLLWLWEREGSFLEAERDEIWEILQLTDQLREELLSEGEVRGWWRYQRLGEIVEFQPQFSNPEEWLYHGLA